MRHRIVVLILGLLVLQSPVIAQMRDPLRVDGTHRAKGIDCSKEYPDFPRCGNGEMVVKWLGENEYAVRVSLHSINGSGCGATFLGVADKEKIALKVAHDGQELISCNLALEVNPGTLWFSGPDGSACWRIGCGQRAGYDGFVVDRAKPLAGATHNNALQRTGPKSGR